MVRHNPLIINCMYMQTNSSAFNITTDLQFVKQSLKPVGSTSFLPNNIDILLIYKYLLREDSLVLCYPFSTA